MFVSDFWSALFKSLGVDLLKSTAYHPQTDDQTEVVNKGLETYLRCMAHETPHTWYRWLPLAEWWYNTSHHSSINTSLFEALYGYAPPLHLPYLPGETCNDTVDRSLQKREEMLKLLKWHLQRAQHRMT